MGVDPRQLLAGVLTVTMFIMLGNMIKRDHFDPLVQVEHSDSPSLIDTTKNSEQSLSPCWSKPALEATAQTQGFVIFSLTNGPDYHVSQVADAVVVARYLQATLVLPDIRGSKPGDKRNFEEIYDVDKFVKSLDGVVRVAKYQPAEVSARNLAVVRIPNQVAEDHIAEYIEPVFRSKGNIRLASYFPSVNMKKSEHESNVDSVACLAMFGTLELQPEVHEVVDSMIERLRTLSRKSDGQFIALDVRVDILEKNGCRGNGASGSKGCYSPEELVLFLRKIGFNKGTTIYVTQSRWDSSLDVLKDFFPKTYTKEGIMPLDKKAKFLDSESSEYEKVIDFHICSQSDVFVPAIFSGLFYSNVAGQRIASGKTQILVPTPTTSGSSASAAYDFISPYISTKNHLAYSCFC